MLCHPPLWRYAFSVFSSATSLFLLYPLLLHLLFHEHLFNPLAFSTSPNQQFLSFLPQSPPIISFELFSLSILGSLFYLIFYSLPSSYHWLDWLKESMETSPSAHQSMPTSLIFFPSSVYIDFMGSRTILTRSPRPVWNWTVLGGIFSQHCFYLQQSNFGTSC